LQAINFVSNTGFEKPRGGRRSAIYQINKNFGMFLGIVILKVNIFFTLTDSCGGFVESFSIKKGNGAYILSIYEGIEKACRIGNVLAIGIGVNGAVDYQSQTLISSKYDSWSNVPLKELIERRYRIVTYLDNIVNHLSVWEKTMNIGQNYQSFLWAKEEPNTEKWGVVLNGTVLRGRHNMCGQLKDDTGLREKEAYLASLQEIGRFLDVECIILGVDSEIVSKESIFDGAIPVHRVKAGPQEMAGACAIAAQLEWFFSILRLV
jgi:hypothetical protein